jgi:hypothetical protein
MRSLTNSWFIQSRLLVPTGGLTLLAIFTVLYTYHPAIYFFIMDAMIKFPAPRVFADGEWIWSSIKCWSEGVNVYVNNTCYDVWPDTSYSYSPLLLRATFLQHLEVWPKLTGLLIAVLFFLSLASLPLRRKSRDQALTLLVMVSGGTFLAIERGNLDLMMFLLVIAALNLLRLPLLFRLAGYFLIALAGLLKFYPFVALIVVLRERTAVLVAVAIASLAALATLVLTYHQELVWMVGNIQTPSYFTLQFGAANLPKGLGITAAKILERVFDEDASTARSIGDSMARSLMPILVVATGAAGVVLGRYHRLPSVMARLSARELDFLIAGAAVISGCFFAGQNVIYRGIFFLLVVPSLMVLSDIHPNAIGCRIFKGTCIAIVFVLWIPFLEMCLFRAGLTTRLIYEADPYVEFPGSEAGYLLWLFSELAWWWIITVLLAVLGSYVVQTELWRMFCRSLRLPVSWHTKPHIPVQLEPLAIHKGCA